MLVCSIAVIYGIGYGAYNLYAKDNSIAMMITFTALGVVMIIALGFLAYLTFVIIATTLGPKRLGDKIDEAIKDSKW